MRRVSRSRPGRSAGQTRERETTVAFSPAQVRELYGKRAKWYDLSANAYYLLGFREWAYRKKAVAALDLSPGDTVVEVGCGTGLNFGFLREMVGEVGRIVGVDLTPEMLDQARARVAGKEWRNVELVESDAARYDFPDGVAGILSTFALTLVPEYDEVVARGADALRPGGRWVIADLKMPEGWSRRLFPLLLPIFRPFGVTADLAERHPWESLERHLARTGMEEHYFGYTYVAWGEKGGGTEQ